MHDCCWVQELPVILSWPQLALVNDAMGIFAPSLFQVWQGHGVVHCVAVIHSPLLVSCWRCHKVVAVVLTAFPKHCHDERVFHIACVICKSHLRLHSNAHLLVHCLAFIVGGLQSALQHLLLQVMMSTQTHTSGSKWCSSVK